MDIFVFLNNLCISITNMFIINDANVVNFINIVNIVNFKTEIWFDQNIQTKKISPWLLRLTYQTHLTVGICPEKYLVTVGICPNLETDSRMTRTFPHGHLYFSRQIPTVNVFKLWIRTLLNSFSKLMEGVTAFLAVFYVSVYKPFLQKTWKTCNLYFPIKHLLSYVVGFPKLWLYLVNFYPCLYNLPNLV